MEGADEPLPAQAVPLSPFERELKFRLRDEGDWRAVQQVLGAPAGRLEQVNAYLDTADGRVAERREMVRLRRENDARVLTYKQGVRAEDGYFEAREFEAPITAEEWERLLGGREVGLEHLEPLTVLRSSVGLGPLRVTGEVRNLRLRYPLANGDVLELDRTEFPGGRLDFEIEVETAHPEEVRSLLEDLAGRAGVPLEVQTRTKYERFLEAAGLR